MTWRSSVSMGALAALACSAWSGSAQALQQPDGTVIPVGTSLQDLFTSRGESIDALADAVTVPETFIPSCALTFEVVQRNAGYNNSFGWYNVTGAAPTPGELYEFLACNDGVGVIKTLSIKNDPNYLGGEIGFYQATGSGCPTPQSNAAIFYSQKAYNPDGNQANPIIHLLTYDSTVVPSAFYFAWEDLLVGGDNDFDDLTTFVTGITCTGGGGECDTGQLGVCAKGIMQCQAGVLTCVPQFSPGQEACDGFDNDCNDLIDEGDLCPVGEVCDKGSCVPECSSGEFVCPVGEVCSPEGLCVDPDCLDVQCDAGLKCVDGDCVGPCDGVTCPYGQECQLGLCLDPCDAVQCDAEQVCEGGICVDHCDCRGCDPGLTCQPSGNCIFDACVGVTCDPGQHCDASGACVDDCEGAVCPTGQTCTAGECVDVTGSGGAGGGGPIGFGGGGSGSGQGADSGSGAGGASGSGASSAGADGSDSGCNCRAAGGPESPTRGLTLFALAGLVASIVRRRRQRTSR